MTTERMRERSVPCFACGLVNTRGVLSPRTMTWNLSGKCDAHEDLAVQVAKRAKEKHDR